MKKSIITGFLSVLIFFGSSGYEEDAKNSRYVIPQGIIGLDSEFAKKIGFVSYRFLSCSYLLGVGNRVIIRTIECTERRRGYLRELFKAIWALGAEIVVITPLSTMEDILMHYGFKKNTIQDAINGKLDLWVK